MAAKGLAAARWYARTAPPVPAALHLPSHIFTRLGLWQESIASNRAAAMAAREELRATQAVGTDSASALHAMDYMLYGYMQLAHDQAARRMLDAVAAVRQIDVEHLEATYALAAMPARYALERRHWEEAATLQLHPKDLAWERFPQSEAVTVFARGLGAARSGKTAAAQQALSRLQTLRDGLGTSGAQYWAEQIDLQRQIVSAWLARAAGKKEEAVKLLRAAAALEDTMEFPHITPGPIAPARELLGELLLDLNQPALALQAFEASQRLAPQRFRGLYGAARAAELAGEKAKAGALYTQLVTMCEQADSERPELSEAKTFLAQQ
jgi:tetratricopeptide (TPR) repeat protein